MIAERMKIAGLDADDGFKYPLGATALKSGFCTLHGAFDRPNSYNLTANNKGIVSF